MRGAPEVSKDLERAFTKDNIGVFWGRSDEFLNELTKQMRAS